MAIAAYFGSGKLAAPYFGTFSTASTQIEHLRLAIVESEDLGKA
jgi:hypothetical protein